MVVRRTLKHCDSSKTVNLPSPSPLTIHRFQASLALQNAADHRSVILHYDNVIVVISSSSSWIEIRDQLPLVRSLSQQSFSRLRPRGLTDNKGSPLGVKRCGLGKPKKTYAHSSNLPLSIRDVAHHTMPQILPSSRQYTLHCNQFRNEAFPRKMIFHLLKATNVPLTIGFVIALKPFMLCMYVCLAYLPEILQKR